MDTIETPSTGKKGSALAIVIVILIIALGGAYFWYGRTAKVPVMKNDIKTRPLVSSKTLQNELNTAGNIDISTEIDGLDQVYK